MPDLTRPFFFFLLLFAGISMGSIAQKPKVWIITDGSDKNIKGNNHWETVSDPDDISALAGYLLMSNMFDTRAIVVGSHLGLANREVADQGEWAEDYFGKAYAADLPNLNKNIGGYVEKINFKQSFLVERGGKFDPDKSYMDLNEYQSVKALFDEAESSEKIINVLCWGILTEPAILVDHCISTGRYDVLDKIRFISHWTNSSFRVGSLEYPDSVHNCFGDMMACRYVHRMALNGHVKFYECSGIGQFGIVGGSPVGEEFWDKFKESEIGKIYAEGKFVPWKKSVDDSDCATYWVLLGNWGVSLNDIASNGINMPDVEQANEAAFYKAAPLIRAELLRRVEAAAGH